MHRWLLVIPALLSCSGDKSGPSTVDSADTDLEADTDTDTDSDSDVDTDTDTDTTGSLCATTWWDPTVAECTKLREIWQAFPPGQPLARLQSLQFEYGIGGVQLEQYEDYTGDLVWEAIVHSTLDGMNQLDYTESDLYPDGVFDHRTTWTWAAGVELVEEMATDVGINGVIDTTLTFSYDAGWCNTRRQSVYGASTHTIDMTYDANGNEILFEVDSTTDGTYDSRTETTWFDDGGTWRIQERTLDYGADGAIDSRQTYTWSGGLLQTLAEDAGDDGSVENISTYTYDANDRETLVQTVDQASGGVWSEVRTTWTCP